MVLYQLALWLGGDPWRQFLVSLSCHSLHVTARRYIFVDRLRKGTIVGKFHSVRSESHLAVRNSIRISWHSINVTLLHPAGSLQRTFLLWINSNEKKKRIHSFLSLSLSFDRQKRTLSSPLIISRRCNNHVTISRFFFSLFFFLRAACLRNQWRDGEPWTQEPSNLSLSLFPSSLSLEPLIHRFISTITS